MSATKVETPTSATPAHKTPLMKRLRDYFWSDNTRAVQTVLGVIWCIDGGLQFQSFMYSRGFVLMLKDGAVGQPPWLHDSIIWGANLANSNLTLWNTLFALVQCLIGLGLLYRPLVRSALVASLAWVFIVWWFGEDFGMLFMSMGQPMTGAPGCVVYGLVALLAWPGARPGGLLGPRGAKIMWATLWIVLAYLWLLAASASSEAAYAVLLTKSSGIGVLSSMQGSLASAAQGHGLTIALDFAALSAVIGIAVVAGWHARLWIYVSIGMNLIIWIFFEGLGGVFAGGATDLNTGPLLVLLACAMLPVIGIEPAQHDA